MTADLIGELRRKLAEGLALGPFSKSMDPAFVEVVGHAGMDFVILDLEHGPNTAATLGDLIRAAEAAQVLPIVRVGSDAEIGKALDLGAGGVQVPHVTSAERVRAVLDAARFAPEGRRGVCRFVRAADYSARDRFDYFRQANQAVIVLQVEGAEGLANLDEILAVGGADVVFVGVYDLSQSLGIVGQVDHPRVVEALEDIRDRCREHGVAVGTFVEDVAAAGRWHASGVSYISYSVDVGIFTEACQGIVEQLRRP